MPEAGRGEKMGTVYGKLNFVDPEGSSSWRQYTFSGHLDY